MAKKAGATPKKKHFVMEGFNYKKNLNDTQQEIEKRCNELRDQNYSVSLQYLENGVVLNATLEEAPEAPPLQGGGLLMGLLPHLFRGQSGTAGADLLSAQTKKMLTVASELVPSRDRVEFTAGLHRNIGVITKGMSSVDIRKAIDEFTAAAMAHEESHKEEEGSEVECTLPDFMRGLAEALVQHSKSLTV